MIVGRHLEVSAHRIEPASRFEVAILFKNITERVKVEEKRQMLANELSHRLKNSFAMVQAIASQSLRNATTINSARAVLISRLQALGSSHDILISGSGESADIGTIITCALKPLMEVDSTRVELKGPPFTIDSSPALSLALMVHELATNASKYGALSTPAGTVHIHWEFIEDTEAPALELRWEETGGPVVKPPLHRGFGSRLIERGLSGATGGRVKMEYLPEGVVCTFTAPKAGLQVRLRKS